jgi:hypothetical protein
MAPRRPGGAAKRAAVVAAPARQKQRGGGGARANPAHTRAYGRLTAGESLRYRRAAAQARGIRVGEVTQRMGVAQYARAHPRMGQARAAKKAVGQRRAPRRR